MTTTEEGVVKGKRGYMAPEHLLGITSRASDLYSTAVVQWELLARRRLFPDDASMPARVAGDALVPIDVAEEPLRGVLLRAMDHDPRKRYTDAREMSAAVEAAGVATAPEVTEWLERVAARELEERARLVAGIGILGDAPSRRARGLRGGIVLAVLASVSAVTLFAVYVTHRRVEPARAEVAPSSCAGVVASASSPIASTPSSARPFRPHLRRRSQRRPRRRRRGRDQPAARSVMDTSRTGASGGARVVGAPDAGIAQRRRLVLVLDDRHEIRHCADVLEVWQ